MPARCVILLDHDYLHGHAKQASARITGLPEDTPMQVSKPNRVLKEGCLLGRSDDLSSCIGTHHQQLCFSTLVTEIILTLFLHALRSSSLHSAHLSSKSHPFPGQPFVVNHVASCFTAASFSHSEDLRGFARRRAVDFHYRFRRCTPGQKHRDIVGQLTAFV